MLKSGDWQNVRFNGDLNFEYAPLFIWLEATSMSVFGVNDFAAKLPAALAGFGTILLVYWIALELRGNRWFATMAMLVLATTQPFLKYSSHAMTDVPFAFLFALSLLLYLKGLRDPRWLVLAGSAVGLAILTRSVTGVLPLFVMGAHLLASGRWKDLLSPYWIGCLALSLLVPLSWLAPQYQAYGGGFIEEHFAFVGRKIQEQGSAGTGFQLGAYGLELLKYYWPWLPVLVAGGVFELRESKHSLAVLWTLAVLAPLTQTAIPYGRYLMPAYPALAILCAVALDRWIPVGHGGKYFRGACIDVLLVGLYTVILPARERGLDMRTVAAIAEGSSQPSQRILLYTYGEQRFDFQNQLLWYADRYTDQIMDMGELVSRQVAGAVGVIDKLSFTQLPDTDALELLGQSENFVCYRVPRI